MAPGASLGSWSLSNTNGDMSTYTTTVSFSTDGDYTLNIAGVDAATNAIQAPNYQGAATQDFTVDLTNPVLSVAYDNNDVRNGSYYNVARTGTITVIEQNFSDAGATVNATIDGTGFSSGSGWSTSGANHSSSIQFGTDGEYNLSVSYVDLAGNPANMLADDNFVVDLTAPVIEFGGAVQDRTAYAGEVMPVVLFHDRNYDSNGKTVTIEGYKNKQIPVSASYLSINDGEQGTVADLEHISSNDDVYVLTAKQTDLAGNETIETMMYSVNRFGSTWYLEGSSKNLVDAYYSNISQEVQIHEINVDEIIEYSVSLSHDGNLNTLAKLDGYQVLTSGDEASWYEYIYAFEGTNFQDEGLYEITVHTTDKAQNTSSNVSPRIGESACPISFVIDKTAPTIVLTGVEEGGRYSEESRTALIDIQDNTIIDGVDVYLNGNANPIASYSNEEIKAGNGKIQYSMQSSNETQELAIVAHDVAGNISERVSVADVFISASNIMIFGLSVPKTFLLGGGISVGLIIVIVAAVLIYMMLVSRKKKEKDTGAAD
jgi:hypothetical protein